MANNPYQWSKPSSRETCNNPYRRLLAAILLRTYRDLESSYPHIQQDAKRFFEDEESVALTAAFGIPKQTVQKKLAEVQEKMNKQKVVGDWIIATQETMYTLQGLLLLLETWRDADRAEPADFGNACQQLRDAGLWPWAKEAAGHGVAALAHAVEVSECEVCSPPREDYPEGKINSGV